MVQLRQMSHLEGVDACHEAEAFVEPMVVGSQLLAQKAKMANSIQFMN